MPFMSSDGSSFQHHTGRTKSTETLIAFPKKALNKTAPEQLKASLSLGDAYDILRFQEVEEILINYFFNDLPWALTAFLHLSNQFPQNFCEIKCFPFHQKVKSNLDRCIFPIE
jgi:hypothetical protein